MCPILVVRSIIPGHGIPAAAVEARTLAPSNLACLAVKNAALLDLRRATRGWDTRAYRGYTHMNRDRGRPMRKSLSLVLFGWLVLEAPVSAYLDPGSGSMLLQVLLGGFAAVGVIVRLYWNRWISWFRRPARREDAG